MWYNASNTDVSSTLPQWKAGDIVGCYMNITEQYIIFYLNGSPLGPYTQLFQKVRYTKSDKIYFLQFKGGM